MIIHTFIIVGIRDFANVMFINEYSWHFSYPTDLKLIMKCSLKSTSKESCGTFKDNTLLFLYSKFQTWHLVWIFSIVDVRLGERFKKKNFNGNWGGGKNNTLPLNYLILEIQHKYSERVVYVRLWGKLVNINIKGEFQWS